MKFSAVPTELTLIPLPAEITEHIRMDVQTDVGHIVKMFTDTHADDLTDLPLGIMARQASKSLRVNLFILCQLGHIIECCPFCVGKKRVRAILLQPVEFGFIHGSFNRN